MRTRDFASALSPTISSINYERMARRLMQQRFGPRHRVVDMPHIVDCPTLTPTHFQSYGQFQCAVRERQAWCKQYAFGNLNTKPMRDARKPEGLRFRFAIGSCATLFRLLHVTDPQMSSAKAGE